MIGILLSIITYVYLTLLIYEGEFFYSFFTFPDVLTICVLDRVKLKQVSKTKNEF